MSDKADDSVGHLTNTLARGGGNLNDPISKSSNARALPRGGGVEVSSLSAHNNEESCMIAKLSVFSNRKCVSLLFILFIEKRICF